MATTQLLHDGTGALDTGDWQRARAIFAAALDQAETAEALDGMARASWWLADVDSALAYRARAFSAYRDRGDVVTAARIAFWLAREYQGVLANPAAANGWFARGMQLAEETAEAAAQGWLDLARIERTTDPELAERYATQAYTKAREASDADLEIYARAARGLARIIAGRVDDGITDLDVALASAVEASSLDTIGDALCTLMLAAEIVGDEDRFARWNETVEGYVSRYQHISLTGFCFTCCGELFVASGRWDEADEWLRTAINALEQTGHRSRCAHPVARLARLRIRQGRLEDADALLAEFRDIPEAVEPLAALALAQDRPDAAVTLVERHLMVLGRPTLPSVPLLHLLAEGRLALGRLDESRQAVRHLEEIAERSRLDRVRGLAALGTARIDRASGRVEAARSGLSTAIAAFDQARLPLDEAVARFELARLAAEGGDIGLAAEEGKAALRGFTRLGADRDADRTAAFLRSIGVRGQTGPKGMGLLTRREREVLELVAAGLTNAEIAERLFISTKTAGNHVSNVLMKLGVRSRTEAAAQLSRMSASGQR